MLVDGMFPYILAFGKFNIKKSVAKSLVRKLAGHLSQQNFPEGESVLDMYCPPALVT